MVSDTSKLSPSAAAGIVPVDGNRVAVPLLSSKVEFVCPIVLPLVVVI